MSVMVIFPSGNIGRIFPDFNSIFTDRENEGSMGGKTRLILPIGKIEGSNSRSDSEFYRSGNHLDENQQHQQQQHQQQLKASTRRMTAMRWGPCCC
jgi:hypothetical protein